MAQSTVAFARTVLHAEAAAIETVAGELDAAFDDAVTAILQCAGRVVVIGIGKSWLIGQKISATLASTGTPSHCMHAAEAAHGDLGRLASGDVVVALSNSGTTEEVLRCIGPARQVAAKVIAMTGDRDAPLARHADIVLCIGAIEEAGPNALAPTASTTAMLALGDALALTVSKQRQFGEADYARFHPGGALGRRLLTVGEVMRTGDRCPTARADVAVADALGAMTRVRAGAVCVVDEAGRLAGLFTDGDLRRGLTEDREVLQRSLGEVMTTSPTTTTPDTRVHAAVGLLGHGGFDELPVVDDTGVVVGLLDIQDVMSSGIGS